MERKVSDQNGIYELFGGCKSIDDINAVAEELYSEIVGEE